LVAPNFLRLSWWCVNQVLKQACHSVRPFKKTYIYMYI
jgi:hypothetical protein